MRAERAEPGSTLARGIIERAERWGVLPEDYLRGRAPGEDAFRRAAALAAEHCRPVADQRGPEDFKRHLVAELTARALRRAADRAAAAIRAASRDDTA